MELKFDGEVFSELPGNYSIDAFVLFNDEIASQYKKDYKAPTILIKKTEKNKHIEILYDTRLRFSNIHATSKLIEMKFLIKKIKK